MRVDAPRDALSGHVRHVPFWYLRFFLFVVRAMCFTGMFLFYFFRTSSVREGCCRQTFPFLFSFPCSADHERGWLQSKVVFSGWQPIRWM